MEIPTFKLFQTVVKEACRDGKISNNEFAILKKVAELLGISVAEGNRLAQEVIQAYKAGKLTFTHADSPELLYRNVLLAFSDDNVIDGSEEDVLNKIKNWLGLKIEDKAKPEAEIKVEVEFETEAEKILTESKIQEPAESIICENGDIKPLRCKSCNGQVPLLRKPEVKCPYCGDSTIIPNAYLEALASRTSFANRQKQAKKLFSKLGSPPTNFENTLVDLDERMFLVSFILSLGAILGLVQMLLFYPLDWYYAAFKGLNMTDVISPWTPSLISTIATFIISVVPFAYLYWTRRKVLTLKHLKTALAAKPPEKAGGPVACRSCGCPFDVPPNATGITCPYCQTDNLLNIPQEWLEGTRNTSIRVGKSAAMAGNTFKRETSLGWESVLSVFLLFIFIGGINWWLVSMRQTPKHLKAEMPWIDNYLAETKVQKVRQNTRVGKSFELNEWINKAMDMEEFFIALKPKQKLKLTWDIIPKTVKLKDYSNLETSLFLVKGYTAGFNSQISKKSFMRNEPAIFKPNIGGWYRVKLFHTAMIQYKLKVELLAEN